MHSHFLIQWTEDADEELFDAVPARDITAPSGKDVLDLVAGDECQSSFANTLYPARVVAVGECTLCVLCVATLKHPTLTHFLYSK